MSEARLPRGSRGLAPLGPEESPITLPVMTRTPLPPGSDMPFIDEALIKYLKLVFKVTLSETNDLRAYDRMLGQQAVIEHLQMLWEAQQNPQR